MYILWPFAREPNAPELASVYTLRNVDIRSTI